MNLFDKFHENIFIISYEIDSYLERLGYRVSNLKHNTKNGYGLCLWYYGDFNTQVCISRKHVIFYQETNMGEFNALKDIEIPIEFLIEFLRDKKSFVKFLNKIFDENANFFVCIRNIGNNINNLK